MLIRALLFLAATLLMLAPAHALAQAAPAADTPSVPVETSYADVNGLDIYYQIHGDLDSGQRPLLVLHGAFMSAEAMAPLVDRFAADRPVIVIAQRGHGRTGAAPGPITFEKLADDAVGVLEALGVETADVLGYSMGGNTAIAMAVRHPDRVGKQVIISATYPQGFMTEAPQARLAILPATSHIGVMARAALIVDLVAPFLEDAKPPMSEGFF